MHRGCTAVMEQYSIEIWLIVIFCIVTILIGDLLYRWILKPRCNYNEDRVLREDLPPSYESVVSNQHFCKFCLCVNILIPNFKI